MNHMLKRNLPFAIALLVFIIDGISWNYSIASYIPMSSNNDPVVVYQAQASNSS